MLTYYLEDALGNPNFWDQETFALIVLWADLTSSLNALCRGVCVMERERKKSYFIGFD